MTAPCVKLDVPLEDYSVICRGCLADSGEMKNMSEWGLIEDFYKITDVKMQESSNLSDLLCTECEDVLLTCKRFRSQCQNSDRILRTTIKKKKPLKLPKISEPASDTTKNKTHNYLFDEKLVIMIEAPEMDSKVLLTCPKCHQEYIKQKDLLFHLKKQHGFPKDFAITLQYYCSETDCPYSMNSSTKFFQGRKFLNQHYNKVHKEKIYSCLSCHQSFPKETDYNRHLKTCNTSYLCQICDKLYRNHETLITHLSRMHPELHKKYKEGRKHLKRRIETATNETEKKKSKTEEKLTFFCDSPKRSFATQTFDGTQIRNDVTLPLWQSKIDAETKTDEISTQTVFEDLLSLKSQTSEDESLFFSENVSLSDIQTQTFPLEFGLSRSNKETLTSGTQSPDLSIKETQTCLCLYESPKINLKLFDSAASSPNSNFASTQTQTSGRCLKSDVMLSFNSAETQTSFEDSINKTM